MPGTPRRCRAPSRKPRHRLHRPSLRIRDRRLGRPISPASPRRTRMSSSASTTSPRHGHRHRRRREPRAEAVADIDKYFARLPKAPQPEALCSSSSRRSAVERTVVLREVPRSRSTSRAITAPRRRSTTTARPTTSIGHAALQRTHLAAVQVARPRQEDRRAVPRASTASPAGSTRTSSPSSLIATPGHTNERAAGGDPRRARSPEERGRSPPTSWPRSRPA